MRESLWGGRIGDHARDRGPWSSALPWAILGATAVWLLLIVRQLPCRTTTVANRPNAMYRMCYSDIHALYQSAHLGRMASPFNLEQPVLTGTFIGVMRAIAQALGAPSNPAQDLQAELVGANVFLAVNAVALFACFLILVVAAVQRTATRPFDGLMVAAAPAVATTGLIGWDLFGVMLTALGVWAWSRRRPALAGALLGLGIAATLYPVLVFVPLLALGLRTRRIRPVATAAGAAVVAWLVPNLAVLATNPTGWQYFWSMNLKRKADLGSPWYGLQVLGITVPQVSALTAILEVAGAAAIIALAWYAPRRPRLGQLAFLILVWFLLVNKVYSPQYALWLLPFVVLARPVWRDWAVWSIGELVYFAAVWGHLAGTTKTPGTNMDRIYVAAIIVRILAQAWVASRVLHDIAHPDDDPLRADGADDVHGGVFDGARDAVSSDRVPGGPGALVDHDTPGGPGAPLDHRPPVNPAATAAPTPEVIA